MTEHWALLLFHTDGPFLSSQVVTHSWRKNFVHFMGFWSNCVYRKLVMVCSRVNLCNNWCIFWLSEATKTLLGITLYTQGISFRTDSFQRVYKRDRDRQRRIWDYYNMFANELYKQKRILFWYLHQIAFIILS